MQSCTLALLAGRAACGMSANPATSYISQPPMKMQTDSTIATETGDCETLWSSLETSLPTPPPEVDMSAWMEAHIDHEGITTYFHDLNDICSFAQFHLPASAYPAYSSFNLEYYSWYSSNSDSFLKLVTECPDPEQYGSPEEQTSELGAVLTAYSSFMAYGCPSDVTMMPEKTVTMTAPCSGEMTMETTSMEMPTTSKPMPPPATVTHNEGRKETSAKVAIAAVVAMVCAVLAL